MNDKIALVTGATQGLGRVAALEIGRTVGTMVIVGRDAKRTDETALAIRAAAPNTTVETILADLSSQAEVRRVAREFKSKHDRLHILVNNAGGIFEKRQLTVDGHELTFALNHLAYFLLAYELMDVLKASAPARIVQVSSGAHAQARRGIRWDDLQFENYGAMGAYAHSKLCNILHTVELSKRLAGTGVTVNAMHPGPVATGFGMNNTGFWGIGIRLVRLFFLTPEQGADTIVYLATSQDVEGVTGKYFAKRREKTPTKWARDPEAAARLWKVSEQLCGIA